MTQLWNRIRDWAVLIMLLITCVVVMVNQNEPLLRSLRAASLEFTARVEHRFAWAGSYVRALEENGTLRNNNMYLSSQVARLREAEHENRRLRALLALRDTVAYRLLPTQIVARDITQSKNYFTVDVGSEDGIVVGMPIVDDQGILGKVVLTSTNYSIVQSYLNTDFRVPAQIQPIGTYGIVRWEGTHTDRRLFLDNVVRTEPVEEGQLVVTSGSLVFPPGLPIGTVDFVQAEEGKNLLRIYLQPASPISKADYVFVILEAPVSEVENLQQEAADTFGQN